MSENLELQLGEIDLLRSMYPDEGEFDDLAIKRARDTIENPEKNDETATLSFSVRINDTIELFCTFPHDYPISCRPKLHARCNERRTTQDRLNRDLNEFVARANDGEPCAVDAVHWLRDNADSYCVIAPENKAHVAAVPNAAAELQRIWFYMHHIYSKTKRKDILAWADELHLSGFSMPGKPGVVCAEGDSRAVDEFSSRLRGMTWKRITIRHQEKGAAGDGSWKRFSGFNEVAFDPHSGRGSRDYHMDLGQFQKYLEEHKSAEMFHMLFGVEGSRAAKET